MAPTTQFIYRKGTLGILLIYLPLLILPWVLTCITSLRPLTQPTYLGQRGQYSPRDIANFRIILVVTRALNSIAALLTVPLVSAILAHAAVVHIQRRKKSQTFTVQQTFALADRAWQDVKTLLGVPRDYFKYGQAPRSSWFLWIGAAVLTLGAIQQPIQQLVVSTTSTQLMTCNDVPIYTGNNDPTCNLRSQRVFYLGSDPEPADLALIPQNIVGRLTAQQISTITDSEPQTNLWPENVDLINENIGLGDTTLFGIVSDDSNGSKDSVKSFFVTNMPNGTTTGVLRQHIMRLNSSISCQPIQASQVPDPCPGTRPFNLTIAQDGNLTISVCVPGAFDQPPWSLTRDRQDIEEEMFITLKVPNNPRNSLFVVDKSTNFTMHCTSGTTRGYFELGNVHNANTHGPLLDKWPEQDDLLANFNDYTGSGTSAPPLENDNKPGALRGPRQVTKNPDPFNTDTDILTPGPLMLTALAIFGNNSFMQVAKDGLASGAGDIALQQICQPGVLPFGRLEGVGAFHNQYVLGCGRSELLGVQQSPQGGNDELLELMYDFVSNFNDVAFAQKMLTAGTFIANRALLTQTVAATQGGSARPLITSDGIALNIPSVSFAAIIGVSALIGLQVLALLTLALYIYSVPTWTASINALCIAKLAAEKEPGAFGRDFESFDRDVARMDGLVGLYSESEEHDVPCVGGQVGIALGGQGLISRDLANKKGKPGSTHPKVVAADWSSIDT